MQVPMLDVRRENAAIAGELRETFARVLASGQFILGPEVERFEAAAAEVAGARFALGVSSGTDALILALMTLGVGPGDEVICPSFTFFATAGSIVRVGARPVFADCCPGSFNLDPSGLEALVTPRTKAIIPVHLFGQPADMGPILEFARAHRIAVIEDAAQSFGAEYQGRKAGALGELGTVSFYPSKNLGAFGDAGLVVTNDPDLARRARVLREHGAEERYYHSLVGGNFRLDALQAALLAVKLPRLDAYTRARQEHAREYDRALADLRDRVVLPAREADRTHIMNQYTIRVPGCRDRLREFLAGQGIATAIYYPVPLHRQVCFQQFGPYPALPVSDALAAEALSLPVFPELTAAEQATVSARIHEFFAQS